MFLLNLSMFGNRLNDRLEREWRSRPACDEGLWGAMQSELRRDVAVRGRTLGIARDEACTMADDAAGQIQFHQYDVQGAGIETGGAHECVDVDGSGP